MTTVFEADLTWTGSAFEPGIQLELDAVCQREGGEMTATLCLQSSPNEIRGQYLFSKPT
jgi:hypothetical protein